MAELAKSKKILGAALYSALEPFHTVSGQNLKSVWRFEVHGSTERFLLEFETACLLITANADDDSVDLESIASFSNLPGGTDVSEEEPWSRFLGKPFFWGWVAMNQQGYCDGILVSFGPIVPQLLLNVVASSIEPHLITG